ncbi:hypothetical protein [Moorena sp. SIO4G3]|uniref:hypothetical protein n=1 Tax=Moorena sp. SIO4G3 TaxID=2607821 RepID=UPI00142A8DD3|nr:hypothetical protein [Moorena sp. SIO4G3]NEO76593.1 hypothetical protein [Moorena sp. SIO4G3]
MVIPPYLFPVPYSLCPGWISFLPFDHMVRYGTDCPHTGYQYHNGSRVPNTPYWLFPAPYSLAE